MARLTEEQIQLLRPFIVGVPEHGPGTFRYPPPRRRRRRPGEPEELPPGFLGALPPPAPAERQGTPRLWPSHGSQNAIANRRTTAVSERFTGPGWLDELRLTLGGFGSNAGGFALLHADDDTGAQTDDADTTPPTGVQVFNSISFQDSLTNLDEIGGIISSIWDGANTARDLVIKLGVPIFRDFFYLKATVRGGSAVTRYGWNAVVRLIEGVPDPTVFL